jgi:hypothetical protein
MDPRGKKCTVEQECSGAYTEAQVAFLATGTGLTADEQRRFARGLVTIADWVSELPAYHPSLEGHRRPDTPIRCI